MSDSLASCAYSFSNLEEERSRTIIFSTDNNLMGTPILTMEEATKICQELNIKVYAFTPTKVGKESEFQSAIQSTGGNSYKVENTDTVAEVVKKIEEEEKAKVDIHEIVHYNDEPFLVYCFVFVIMMIVLVLEKKVEVS